LSTTAVSVVFDCSACAQRGYEVAGDVRYEPAPAGQIVIVAAFPIVHSLNVFRLHQTTMDLER
jgi:hypothetical protein